MAKQNPKPPKRRPKGRPPDPFESLLDTFLGLVDQALTRAQAPQKGTFSEVVFRCLKCHSTIRIRSSLGAPRFVVCPFCTPAPAPPPPAASPAAPDYYEILGIAHYSTATEIKQQYRRLAFMFHPDRNPGDRTAEEKFKRISEAYEVLSDPEKRRRYDRIGWTH